MPVCEADPWRRQYFEGVPCPAHVRVPTEDVDANAWNPDHAWVYDKIRVAQSQGLACGDMNAAPPSYPVFVKPIVNLHGMGRKTMVLHDEAEFERDMEPGLFWSKCLTGEHVSTDAAVVKGTTRWWRHTVGKPGPRGTFDYWTVAAAAKPDLETYCGAWVSRHLRDYTGMINLESIGGKIIEVHLRFADQWVDLYGANPWVAAVIRLYERGEWRYDDADRRDGYSVVLFGEHGPQYRHPPRALVDEILRMPHVSSVQITFHEDKPMEDHAMPPGGFRLAVVNAWDLQAGMQGRARLAEAFAAQSH